MRARRSWCLVYLLREVNLDHRRSCQSDSQRNPRRDSVEGQKTAVDPSSHLRLGGAKKMRVESMMVLLFLLW